jgi:hypothetical protein
MGDIRESVTAREAVIYNDDLLSYIFMHWVDPRSCLAVCLVSRRFNALYRLRVPGPLCSFVSQHSSRVEQVRWALGLGMDPEAAICAAALHGHLNSLKYLCSQEQSPVWTEKLCWKAASGGHVDVLQWLRSQDPPCPWSESACDNASGNGHLDVVQWLRSQYPPCPWLASACDKAARNGHLDVVQWLCCQSSIFFHV